MIAGQLSAGIESLTCFNKGIEILKRFFEEEKANNQPNQQNLQNYSNYISTAYCSMAEIFMTDCCMEQGAEQECTKVIEEAIKWNNQNPEAYLLQAQCLLAKSEPTLALPSITTSYSLWKDKEENEWPQYSVRVTIAKIFIELSQLPEATELLEKLTHEDDEDSEVWYLLALCYYNIAEENESEIECFQDAKECITRCLAVCFLFFLICNIIVLIFLFLAIK